MSIKYSRSMKLVVMLLTLMTLQTGCNSTISQEANARSSLEEGQENTTSKGESLQDAEELYSDAMARAKQESKNVFIHLSGPG